MPSIKFLVNFSGYVPNYPAKQACDLSLATATAQLAPLNII